MPDREELKRDQEQEQAVDLDLTQRAALASEQDRELIDLDSEDSFADVLQKRLRERGERLSTRWLTIFREFAQVLKRN